MGIMSSTPQQNGFHAKRAKLYNSKVTVVLGKLTIRNELFRTFLSLDSFITQTCCAVKFPIILAHMCRNHD